jgi:hypothetical protein
VYASLAVAPLMVVTPILQLSLVFRLFLSQLINRDHEVMNTAVLIGAFTAVLGSILVSLDTEELAEVRIRRRVCRRSCGDDRSNVVRRDGLEQAGRKPAYVSIPT